MCVTQIFILNRLKVTQRERSRAERNGKHLRNHRSLLLWPLLDNFCVYIYVDFSWNFFSMLLLWRKFFLRLRKKNAFESIKRKVNFSVKCLDASVAKKTSTTSTGFILKINSCCIKYNSAYFICETRKKMCMFRNPYFYPKKNDIFLSRKKGFFSHPRHS